MTDNKIINYDINFKPKNIKRFRQKKFTEKRKPYKTYNNANWNWNDIFIEINELKINKIRNFIQIVSNKYGIIYSTLKNKFYDFYNKKNIIKGKDNRGGSNKIFNYNQELEIIKFLKVNFIDKNEMLCDQMIKIYASNFFKSLQNKKIFNASSGWCSYFKNRFYLSTVKCSIFKKSTTIYTDKQLNEFNDLCIEKHKLVGSDYFFNCDEMKINNINVSSTTIHIKGTDNAKINVNGNEKEGVTTTLIINASGLMLKPIITAKGKTNLSLKKYKLNNDVIGTYSNNGWMNAGIMKILLNTISEKTLNKHSCLLLDQHPSHTTQFVKNYASEKKIDLIYVPKGYTYKYQPLDAGINGIIKQKSKAIWRSEKIKNPNLKITNADGIKHLLTSINEISKETIIKSFYKSCFIKNINYKIYIF